MDGLYRRLVVGKQHVDATLHHRFGDRRQGGYVTLRKSNPDHEVLILTVAQVDQTLDEAVKKIPPPVAPTQTVSTPMRTGLVQGKRRRGGTTASGMRGEAVALRKRPRPWGVRAAIRCTIVPSVYQPRLADAT